MNIEFLTGLGLDEETAAAVLAQAEDIANAEYERGLSEGRAELENFKAGQAISALLSECGAKNPEILKPLINMDAVTFENGEISGLQEQIAAIKAENPFLFEEEGTVPRFTARLKSPDKISKGNFERMSYMDRVKLYSQNPTLYKQLKG